MKPCSADGGVELKCQAEFVASDSAVTPAAPTPVASQSPPEQLKLFLLRAQQRAHEMYATAAMDSLQQADTSEIEVGDIGKSPNGSTPMTSFTSELPWASGSASTQRSSEQGVPVHSATGSASTAAWEVISPAQKSLAGTGSFLLLPAAEPAAPLDTEEQRRTSDSGRQHMSPVVSLSPRLVSPRLAERLAGGAGGVLNESALSHSPPLCRAQRAGSDKALREGRGSSLNRHGTAEARSGSRSGATLTLAERLERDASNTGVSRASSGHRVSLRSIRGSLSIPIPVLGLDTCPGDRYLLRSPRATIGNSPRDTAELLVANRLTPRGRLTPR